MTAPRICSGRSPLRLPMSATGLALLALAGAVAMFDTTRWVHAGYERSASQVASDPRSRVATAPIVGDEAYWLARSTLDSASTQSVPLASVSDTTSIAPRPRATVSMQVGDRISIAYVGTTRIYTVSAIAPPRGDDASTKLDAQASPPHAAPATAHSASIVTLTAPADAHHPAHTLQLILAPPADVSSSSLKAL